MTEKYDLHCHSTASDGSLSPTEVVQRAHQQGVTTLALTDHDTTAGLVEAQQAASQLGMRLINGIELSALYQNQCLHILGLNIDPNHPALVEGIARQQELRTKRAQTIAEKLAKKGIENAYEEVSKAVGSGEITRLHFAEFLVKYGYAATPQHAFDRFLSKGQHAYVPTAWASLEDVVQWIVAAGGIPVLAHPFRYNLSYKWINRMLPVFKQLGGLGVEIINGRSNEDEIRLSRKVAEQHKLLASVGSDFHSPDNQWVELGKLPELPAALPAVWELF